MIRDRTSGFFTIGLSSDQYDLPHPAMGLPVILLIRRVLLRAFEILREENYDLENALEDRITADLRSVIMNNLRETGSVNGFNKHTFEAIIRQGQWANYDDSITSKTPDLCFQLRHDESRRVIPEFDALFIECKPVDDTHPVGSKYCDDGLIRFVRGDYAWAMQESMMLAYTRNRRSIGTHLIPAMKNPDRMLALKTKSLPVPSSSPAASATTNAEAVHISQHKRDFSWPHGKGFASDITIYHLWHDCSKVEREH